MVFDLDGTVLDTREDIADCMNMTLKHLGYSTYDYEKYRTVIGNDAPNFMRKLMGDMPIETLMYIWESYIPFVEKYGTEKSKVFDGISEVLCTLKQRGYVLYLITNKTPSELAPFIDKFLTGLGFDYIEGIGGTENAKPSPNKIFDLLKKHNVKPENLYIVGDGETDMLTAVNSGTIGIGVLWGNRDEDQLLESGAKYIVDEPNQLLEIMK